MFCLIDFEDSFTYNIAALFKKENIQVDIIKWQKLNPEIVDRFSYFVFGPGPGHVEDYKSIQTILNDIIFNQTKFTFGVCLGHQLIFHAYRAKMIRWENPLHGRSLEISLPEWLGGTLEKVQFYNSWGVDPKFSHDEISLFTFDQKVLAARGTNFLSFQFHPESVGTSCPKTFFRPVFEFYYNSKDEPSDSTRRNL